MKLACLCLLMVGCSDYCYASLCSDPQAPNAAVAPTVDPHCTSDDQCTNGFVCYKTTASYVGVCAEVH